MALLANYPTLRSLLEAAGLTVFHTLWAGCILLLLLIIVLKVVPASRANGRFTAALMTLHLLFFFFIATFCYQWNQRSPLPPVTETVVALPPSSSLVLPTDPHTTTAPALTPTEVPWSTRLNRWAPWVAALWLLGCLYHTIQLLLGWRQTQQLRIKAESLPNYWEKQFSSLKQPLGIRQAVAFRQSGRTTVPLTFGWLKPVVLIPAGLLTQLSPEQVEMIVLHELAHIRRYDYLWSLSQSVAEVVLFYHPAYWYIARVLEREREFACDQVTIGVTRQPETYARTLLEVASTTAPAHGLAISGKRGLLTRIRRIVTPAQGQRSASVLPVLVLIGVLGLASVAYAWQLRHPTDQDRTNETINTPTKQSTTDQEKQWIYILNGRVQTVRPAFLDQDHMKGQWETFTIPKAEEWIKPYLTATQQRLLLDSTYGGILFIISKELLDDLNRTNSWPPPSATHPDQKKKQNFEGWIACSGPIRIRGISTSISESYAGLVYATILRRGSPSRHPHRAG